MQKGYYPAKTVAEKLGISPATLYDYLKRGYIGYVTFDGLVRIPIAEVNRILEEDKEFMTITQASEYFDLKPRKIRDMIKRGDLRTYRMRGFLRVRKKEVEEKFLHPQSEK